MTCAVVGETSHNVADHFFSAIPNLVHFTGVHRCVQGLRLVRLINLDYILHGQFIWAHKSVHISRILLMHPLTSPVTFWTQVVAGNRLRFLIALHYLFLFIIDLIINNSRNYINNDI